MACTPEKRPASVVSTHIIAAGRVANVQVPESGCQTISIPATSMQGSPETATVEVVPSLAPGRFASLAMPETLALGIPGRIEDIPVRDFGKRGGVGLVVGTGTGPSPADSQARSSRAKT